MEQKDKTPKGSAKSEAFSRYMTSLFEDSAELFFECKHTGRIDEVDLDRNCEPDNTYRKELNYLENMHKVLKRGLIADISHYNDNLGRSLMDDLALCVPPDCEHSGISMDKLYKSAKTWTGALPPGGHVKDTLQEILNMSASLCLSHAEIKSILATYFEDLDVVMTLTANKTLEEVLIAIGEEHKQVLYVVSFNKNQDKIMDSVKSLMETTHRLMHMRFFYLQGNLLHQHS